ncbi:hypothetical protein [Legionella sp. CNM-4043-24]|uniref:hypothetical protein n=1 Tax=Legionella sp. CNM-4043-24 TaxID=3421646 RepID=UPI00403B170C
MPKLTKTHILLSKYREILISGLASDNDLIALLQIDNFTKSPGMLDISAPISDSNHNKIDAMIDFVEAVTELMPFEAQHRLTGRLLRLSVNTTSSLFMQKASLEKVFLYHELATNPTLAGDHFDSEPFTSMYPKPEDRAAFTSSMIARAQEYFKLTTAQTSSPASSSHAVAKRPLALLDVDHTLLFDKRLNTDLLDSLKNHDIKDVYLFTDMVFQSGCINDRKALITTLQEMGFSVHGTISTSDLFWKAMDDDLVAFIYRKLHEVKVSFRSAIFAEHFAQMKIERPIIETLLASGTLSGTLGHAFPEACLADEACAMSAYPKSYVIKFLAEMIQSQRALVDPKGLMFELFLNHIPEWVGSLVIADDKPKVFESIEQYLASATSTTGRRPTSLPITNIHVTDLSMGLEHYNRLLQNEYRLISQDIESLELPHAGPSSSFPSSHSSSMSSLSSSPVYAHVARISPQNPQFRDSLLEALKPQASGSRISSFFSSRISRAKTLFERLSQASSDDLIPILQQHFRANKKIETESPEHRLLRTIQSSGLLKDSDWQALDLDIHENRQLFRGAFLDYSSQHVSAMSGLK